MSSHLVLFAQVPINSKFRFERADAGKVFVKSSDEGAHHDGAYQPVNSGVLVFPVPNPIVTIEFTLLDGTRHTADPIRGQWHLDADHDEPGVIFRTLEDVINHLGV